MSKVTGPGQRLLGHIERTATVTIGAGGMFGVLNLLVEDSRPSDAAVVVTILVPFPPATAVLLRLPAGTPLDVSGRPENGDGADPLVHVLRAERITVLAPSCSR